MISSPVGLPKMILLPPFDPLIIFIALTLITMAILRVQLGGASLTPVRIPNAWSKCAMRLIDWIWPSRFAPMYHDTMAGNDFD